MTNELLNKFRDLVHYFTIEAERDKDGNWHYTLRCRGYIMAENYELKGDNLNSLIKRAVLDGMQAEYGFLK